MGILIGCNQIEEIEIEMHSSYPFWGAYSRHCNYCGYQLKNNQLNPTVLTECLGILRSCPDPTLAPLREILVPSLSVVGSELKCGASGKFITPQS